MWQKFKPAVQRHWLFAIAGVIWMAVGVVLCVRAVFWLSPFAFGTTLFAELVAVIIAATGYAYGFSPLVQKNISRIHRLPDRSCAFAFTAWRGYLIVGIMVTIGVALRSSSIPKHYLSIPYMAMGSILLMGAVTMFRHFISLAYQDK